MGKGKEQGVRVWGGVRGILSMGRSRGVLGGVGDYLFLGEFLPEKNFKYFC